MKRTRVSDLSGPTKAALATLEQIAKRHRLRGRELRALKGAALSLIALDSSKKMGAACRRFRRVVGRPLNRSELKELRAMGIDV